MKRTGWIARNRTDMNELVINELKEQTQTEQSESLRTAALANQATQEDIVRCLSAALFLSYQRVDRMTLWHRRLAFSGWLLIAVAVAGCAGSGVPSAPIDLAPAIAALDQGETAMAKRLLDDVLARDPQHGQALLYRAQAARDEGDDAAALGFLARVTADNPRQLGTARYLEGSILIAAGDAAGAEQKWRESIELHSGYAQPRERLAELFASQMRGDDLREVLDQLRSLRGWTLLDLVRYQGADVPLVHPDLNVPVLEDYLQHHPEDLHSTRALARSLLIAGRPQQVHDLLERVPPGFAGDEILVAARAEAFVEQGNLPAAGELLGEDLPPETAPVSLWDAHAALAAEMEDWPVVAACSQRVLEAHPDDRRALYNLATALQRMEYEAEARPVFVRLRHTERLFDAVSHILEGDPARTALIASIAGNAAEALIQLQRPAEALAWLQQSQLLDPGSFRIQRMIAQARTAPQVSVAAQNRLLPGSFVAPERHASFQNLPAVAHERTESVAGVISLVDLHESAGLDFQYDNGAAGSKFLLESLGGAVAVIDFDCDGWPDLYFAQGCPLPVQAGEERDLDQLFRNRGDGTFENVTSASGIREFRYSEGCAVGDFDNDGDPDLFVANYGPDSLYINNGDGTFTDSSEQLAISGESWSAGAAFADLDGDGHLDLYVVNYLQDAYKVCRTPGGAVAACAPGNFLAEQDVLCRNSGDGDWTDVTVAAGIIAPEGKGLGIVTCDLDDDGRQDIYVANDGTPNFLFRNLSTGPGEIRFEERALTAGCALSGDGRSQAGMGIACADFNRDARFDLYVTHFYNDYNTLYLNQGDVLFDDATRSAQLVDPTMAMLGFGVQAIDFDLDGDADLLVANGHIDDLTSEGIPWKMPAQLFANDGSGRFAEVSRTAGDYFGRSLLGRGVSRIDVNRDGAPDAVIVHQDAPAVLLENRTEHRGNWFSIRLVGGQSNRDAIGARLTLIANDQQHVVEWIGGGGYACANDPVRQLGLGAATSVEELRIDWPDGWQDVFRDVPVDTHWVCAQQPDGKPSRLLPMVP